MTTRFQLFATTSRYLYRPIMLMMFCFAAPLAATLEDSPRALAKSSTPQTITLKDAFTKALENHTELRLAENHLDQSKARSAIRFSALLPKLRLGSSILRNFPEVKNPLPESDPMEATLYRDVANLVRKGGDAAEADLLETHADSFSRRDVVPQLVLNPKYEARAGLTLEVPLFNGTDLALVLASNENNVLHQAQVQEVTAKTIHMTAQAYFLALHWQGVLAYREQEEKVAREQLKYFETQKKRGANYLHAHASLLARQAEKEAALNSFRTSLAKLGLMIGAQTEFLLENPSEMIFEILSHDTDKLQEVALQNRWELKVEKQAIFVAQNERMAHFLNFLPNLWLQGDIFYTSNDKGLLGENLLYAISLNASINLFEGGMSFSKLRETGLRRQEHEIKLRQIGRDIDATIRGRKDKIAELTLMAQAYEAKTIANKESEKAAEQKHKKGTLLFEDYLDIIERRINSDIAVKNAQLTLTDEKLALTYEAGLFTPQYVR